MTKELAQIHLYNVFNGGKVFTWNELLTEMSNKYGMDKDTVFHNMNELIDNRKIECPQNEVYCHAGEFKKKQAREAQEKAGRARANIDANAKTLTRKEYDLLHPYQQADFCKNDGRITA